MGCPNPVQDFVHANPEPLSRLAGHPFRCVRSWRTAIPIMVCCQAGRAGGETGSQGPEGPSALRFHQGLPVHLSKNMVARMPQRTLRNRPLFHSGFIDPPGELLVVGVNGAAAKETVKECRNSAGYMASAPPRKGFITRKPS